MYIVTFLAIALGGMLRATPTSAEPVPEGERLWAEAKLALERDDLPQDARMRLHLYHLVNSYRAERGLYPLALDQRLNASATAHSSDMAAMGVCRHYGSDGSSSRDRMGSEGYNYNNWAGENIICARQSPEAAMKWWKASTPHRKNLLHQHFTHIGVGFDPNGPWGPMWTLNFAAGDANFIPPASLSVAGVQAPSPEPPTATATEPATATATDAATATATAMPTEAATAGAVLTATLVASTTLALPTQAPISAPVSAESAPLVEQRNAAPHPQVKAPSADGVRDDNRWQLSPEDALAKALRPSKDSRRSSAARKPGQWIFPR